MSFVVVQNQRKDQKKNKQTNKKLFPFSTMSTVIGLEQITAAAARVAGSVHKTDVGVG